MHDFEKNYRAFPWTTQKKSEDDLSSSFIVWNLAQNKLKIAGTWIVKQVYWWRYAKQRTFLA